MVRILIIEDDELVRYSLRQVLESGGYDVTEATNGNEGIDCQKAAPFDLVITDLIMPEKEGIETIIELTKDFPALPIIAISGGGQNMDPNFLEAARKLGAKKLLVKPVSSKAILDCVESCMADDE